MKYGLEEKPPPLAFFLYGVQWWVVTLPSVVIVGVLAARMHYTDIAAQTWFMQKLFAVMGTATVLQVLWGHRLPLVIGPASALLVGLVASSASGIDALYSSIFLGGVLLTLAGFGGALSRLRVFFTSRIIAVTLVLIALTLAPAILGLIFSGPADRFAQHASFAAASVFLLVFINEKLPGAAKSLTVLIGMAGGTAAYFFFWGVPTIPSWSEPLSKPWFISPVLEPGTLLAFVFCFLALAVNELGSIESIGRMLQAENMDQRIRRGSGVAGLANMASGALGVIGPVDFSMSAGIMAATGCASRLTLIPAGAGLAACAFFPQAVVWLNAIPQPVMGALFIYLMASQLASGLTLLTTSKGVTDFSNAVTVALPLMLGLLVAFAPAEAFSGFPDVLRPVIGNGFVMGVIAVIFLEHGIFANHKQP